VSPPRSAALERAGIAGIDRVRLRAPILQGDAPLAAFTVDVEDWYQSCVDLDAPISERVVRNVDRLLEVLDDSGVKGTFFVQGRVADTFPRMVARLATEGHELQSHGHTHRSLARMTRKDLREELRRARAAVEDAAGVRVKAFRAPDFSIVSANLWAVEVLAEAGFEMDSSIFPMRSRHYGISGWELAPHRIGFTGGAEILEVPVAVWEARGLRFPVAGGGYFRLLPATVLARGLNAVAESLRPPIVYCHPYEFNARELDDFRGQIPGRQRLSQSVGRGRFIPRLKELFAEMPFGRFDRVLREWGIAA
jgi:polysaccharide deacetylase family protein (PEP-CTERM system associated)